MGSKGSKGSEIEILTAIESLANMGGEGSKGSKIEILTAIGSYSKYG